MTIEEFNVEQSPKERLICELLMLEINKGLPEAESKIGHRHPVWFLEGNPIVGYSKLKGCIRLMFWSGMGFEEEELQGGSGKFKDASIRYTSAEEVNVESLQRWLSKSREIQWDYKNIYKKKGRLDRLK